MPRVIQGNSAEKLLTVADDSVDLLCTDHPYRYGFMGKEWDKKQDFTPIWEQCIRVMKPGALGFIMNAPRSDCQLLLLSELAAVGFNIKFSPILWAYNSGFPKAGDTSKLIDKRLGLKREVVGTYEHPGRKDRSYQTTSNVFSGDRKNDKIGKDDICQAGFGHSCNQSGAFFGIPKSRKRTFAGDHDGEWDNAQISNGFSITKPACPESARFEGSKVGHQMKPAFEVVTVVMKPLNQPTYIDQALHNGKGVTWIDDCRIPYGELTDALSMFKANPTATPGNSGILGYNSKNQESVKKIYEENNQLKQQKTKAFNKLKKQMVGGRLKQEKRWTYGDEQVDGFKPQAFEDVNINLKGRYPANLLVSDEVLGAEISKYYSLDAWVDMQSLPKDHQETYPFLFVPKASKSEKNKGLGEFETKQVTGGGGLNNKEAGRKYGSIKSPSKNSHPTSKPIQLMSYLVTLGSRPGDLVLDPFAGSGTTGIACKLESRDYILIELMPEYYAIMKARLKATLVQQKLM